MPAHSHPPRGRGAAFALAAAALFGAGAPLSKLLLPRSSPLMLSALLYLGAGSGLSLFTLLRPASARDAREAPVRRADYGVLAGMIVLGGVLGPLLMLAGLERVSGLAGSLLLNLEAPLTIALALVLFREHLGRRASIATLLILVGAAVVGYRPGELSASRLGALALAGACLSWAFDNNLSQRLSLRDPIAVVRIKTLGAGVCSLLLALTTGGALPTPSVAVPALVLGSLSYGVSLLFVMQALRLLGAARQAAYFATAPFIGALLSIPLLGDRPAPTDFVAGALMAVGVILLGRERHGHAHVHEPLEHDHAHAHDEHHRHRHEGAFTEPHAHPHRHEAIGHDHPHAPDLHHRHEHR